MLMSMAAGACGGRSEAAADGEVVARAGGRELTVGEASRLLASNRRVAADSQSVAVLADFWVNYMLLDSALKVDSVLGDAKLDRVIAPERDQAVLMKLRDVAVHADTSFTAEELAREAKARGIDLAAARDEPSEERRREERDEREAGGEAARELRRALAASAQRKAEGAYLDSVMGANRVTLAPGALEIMRQVAADPTRAMESKAAKQPIVQFRGGVLTAGEFAASLQGQPFEFRSSVAAAPKEQLEDEARRLTANKLLLAEAKRRGVTLTPAEEAAVRARTRAAVDTALMRVRELAKRDGRPAALPVVFADAVAGRGQLVPLGQLGVVLRSMYPNELEPKTFPEVARRAQALRSTPTTEEGAGRRGGAPSSVVHSV
jgi:hypothetical protein